jgi:hypothetical protein
MDSPVNYKTSFFNKLLPDIIALLFLIATGLKLLHGVGSKLDLPLNDEVFYIYRGLIIPFTGWHNTDWGMLYSLWYWFLSLFNSDPAQLFYLNFKITTVIPPLLFYVLLRKNKVQAVTALLISWMLMISLGNLMTLPRVTHLGLILLIIPLFFINPEKKMLVSGWFLIIFLLVASYIRPEFMLAAILAFGFMGYHSIRKYKLYNPGLLITGWLAVILIIIALAYFFRLPWLMDQSHRGFFALCQHFSFNYAVWHPGTVNSWYNSPEIIQKVFGQADSYGDLITGNPVMLLKHMCFNGFLFIKYIFGITFIHNKLILPDSSRLMMYLEGAIMFTGFLGWSIWTWVNNNDLVKRNYKSNRKLFLLFIFIGLPAVFGSIIIYPRWHYMIVVIYFLLAFLSILIFSRNKKNRDKKSLLMAGFIIFLLTRTFSTAWIDTSTKIPQSGIIQEVKKVVNEVKNSSDTSKKTHFILDSQTGIGIYLMPAIQPVYDYQKTLNLSNFLLGNRIDMVLVDSNFMYSEAYKMYKREWDDFVVYPCKFGFKIKYITVPGYNLFIQDSLLFK